MASSWCVWTNCLIVNAQGQKQVIYINLLQYLWTPLLALSLTQITYILNGTMIVDIRLLGSDCKIVEIGQKMRVCRLQNHMFTKVVIPSVKAQSNISLKWMDFHGATCTYIIWQRQCIKIKQQLHAACFSRKRALTALSWLVHQESFKTDPTIGWQTSRDKKKMPKYKPLSAKLAKPRYERSSRTALVHFLSANQKQRFLPSGCLWRQELNKAC